MEDIERHVADPPAVEQALESDRFPSQDNTLTRDAAGVQPQRLRDVVRRFNAEADEAIVQESLDPMAPSDPQDAVPI